MLWHEHALPLVILSILVHIHGVHSGSIFSTNSDNVHEMRFTTARAVDVDPEHHYHGGYFSLEDMVDLQALHEQHNKDKCDQQHNSNSFTRKRSVQQRYVPVLPQGTIHGANMIGVGIDATLMGATDIDMAIKSPLFPVIASTSNATYSYPLKPSVYYKVPEYIFIRTATETFTEAKLFNTFDQYQTDLQLKASLSVDMKSSGTSGSSGGAESAFGKAMKFGAFKGSAEVAYVENHISTNTTNVANNLLVNAVWQLLLDSGLQPQPLILSNMAAIFWDSNPESRREKLYRFVSRYGTHYITSVLMGGMMEMNSIVDKRVTTDTNIITAALAASFENLFGFKVNGNASLAMDQQRSHVDTNTTRSISVKGGHPSTQNFFTENDDPIGTFQSWQASIIENPVPIRYKLREVSTLFEPFGLRVEAHTAVVDYIGNMREFVEEVEE